jgi:hypothetical protein
MHLLLTALWLLAKAIGLATASLSVNCGPMALSRQWTYGKALDTKYWIKPRLQRFDSGGLKGVAITLLVYQSAFG